MPSPSDPGATQMSEQKKRRPARGAKPRPFEPWRDREVAIERLLVARDDGATLREAAAAAGVHVSTACRWARRSPTLAAELADSAAGARLRRYASRPKGRPRVPCHPRCPVCGAAAEVRGAWGYWPHFWRCSRWPWCRWASWRPRHMQDCPDCGGPRYWSHSRLSVSCPGCGSRVRCDSGADRPVAAGGSLGVRFPVTDQAV
jgi:hypothetical protein